MDQKRIFLYIALAIAGYFIVMAWHNDYPTKTTQPVAPTHVAQAASATSTSQIPVSQNTAVLHQIAKVPAHRIITVNTDLLQLKIDTLGGTIIQANLMQYPTSLHTKNQPFELLNNNPDTRYIAQSGVAGLTRNNKPLQYRVAKTTYTLPSGEKALAVDLTWRSPQGVNVTKRFTFSRDHYVIGVSYLINNHSHKTISGQIYTQLSRKWPLPKNGKGFIHAMSTYDGAAISTPDKLFQKVTYKSMGKENIDLGGKGGWVAMVQQYFLSAWVPNAQQDNHFYSRKSAAGIYSIGMVGPVIPLPPGAKTEQTNQLYLGPQLTNRLKAIAPGLDLTIDYGIFSIFSVPLFWVLQHLYNLIGNWGWSIILITAMIRVLFYKLSAASYRSMASMRRLQPKIAQLKERFGDEKQKLSQAMMDLYRKEKVNPLGGCLPILVQIPVFIALYWVLIESVQLRQAPFIFWIHDLSAYDPYYVLPILMGISMLIQQKLSPPPPDPTQAKVMMFLPLVFTYLFLHFPAGLVLYWAVNNSLAILQQWLIMRKHDKVPA